MRPGQFATASGQFSRALGDTASAFGQSSLANGDATTAIGRGANATGTGATALGAGATAGFANSTAIGNGASTNAANQVSIGTSFEHLSHAGHHLGREPRSSVRADSVRHDRRERKSCCRRLRRWQDISGLQTNVAVLQGNVAVLQTQMRQAFEGTAMAIAMGGSCAAVRQAVRDLDQLGHVPRRECRAILMPKRASANTWCSMPASRGGFAQGGVGGRVGATFAW